jgi:cyclophilin family peptidyl-prolyl cis-trans isomerase
VFRVIKDRWAQFGINGDPAIAGAWRRRTFADDLFVQSNVRGTIAFTFAIPNGRTTQVFVNLQDNSLEHDVEPFVPFGRVTQARPRRLKPHALRTLIRRVGRPTGGRPGCLCRWRCRETADSDRRDGVSAKPCRRE